MFFKIGFETWTRVRQNRQTGVRQAFKTLAKHAQHSPTNERPEGVLKGKNASFSFFCAPAGGEKRAWHPDEYLSPARSAMRRMNRCFRRR